MKMIAEISQKLPVQKKIVLALVLLVLVGSVSFLVYKLKVETPSQEQLQTRPSIVSPLPPTVIPGKLVVQTLPAANVALKFWTWQWKPDPSPPAKFPNARTLQKVEVPGSALAQNTNSKGIIEFDLKNIPTNVEADITIEKGSDKIHFLAAFDPYFGAVFVVPKKNGVLTLDLEKTEFAAGKPAEEYHGPQTLKVDQKASLTILEN